MQKYIRLLTDEWTVRLRIWTNETKTLCTPQFQASGALDVTGNPPIVATHQLPSGPLQRYQPYQLSFSSRAWGNLTRRQTGPLTAQYAGRIAWLRFVSVATDTELNVGRNRAGHLVMVLLVSIGLSPLVVPIRRWPR